MTSNAPVNREQKSEGSHSLLTTRKLLHIPESFHGWHCVVFDSGSIRFLSKKCFKGDNLVSCVLTSLSSKLKYATPPMGDALPFVKSLYT